jgi:hypothetical protein
MISTTCHSEVVDVLVDVIFTNPFLEIFEYLVLLRKHNPRNFDIIIFIQNWINQVRADFDITPLLGVFWEVG